MTIEKWENIKGHIKDSFEVEDEGKEHIEEDGGVNVEFIEFRGPLGRMRIEFVDKPIILDKKTSYSKRIGSETGVHYIYSETERTYHMSAYKWSEESEEWIEMEAKNLDKI
jgi:hypothetical protein